MIRYFLVLSFMRTKMGKVTIDEIIRILRKLQKDPNKVEIEFDNDQFLAFHYRKVGPRSRKVEKGFPSYRYLFLDDSKNDY